MAFDDYERLLFEHKPNGVLLITINRPEKYNAADARMLAEFTRVWRDVDADPETRVAVITGAGKAFSAGGDLGGEQTRLGDFAGIAHTMEEARGLVANIIDCSKPIISAINGVAVGAGLAIALLADISVIGQNVRIADGHVRIGLAAGDHAAIIWPLLCGMAKAKYYLLTADFINGAEADRIGLVSRAVPDDEVLTRALEIADGIGRGPQHAIRLTKRAANHWVKAAQPTFEASLAFEMLTFFSDDAQEGIAARIAKRTPAFNSAAPPEI
jgi:enoyl-CoA hydratase